MSRITALRVGRNRRKQVKIFLNGKFAFNLEAEVAIKRGLQVGQELTDTQMEALARANISHRCLNAALHYISYRPRSEAELRKHLCQRGFDSDNVEAAISKLKEQGLVNDEAFAQFWKDNRESFSPRSQWLTKLELRRKGVDSNIADQVVNTIDDENNAYRAALKKAPSLPLSEYQNFRRRLGSYLKRRGFNYEVINHCLEKVWQELGGKSG